MSVKCNVSTLGRSAEFLYNTCHLGEQLCPPIGHHCLPLKVALHMCVFIRVSHRYKLVDAKEPTSVSTRVIQAMRHHWERELALPALPGKAVRIPILYRYQCQYNGTSLKGLSVLRTQYKKPPY